MSEQFRTHPVGPTPGVQPLLPFCLPASENCEIDLQIGIFFDGTGNNQDWDDADGCEPGLGSGMSQRLARKDSNVARLCRAYPDKAVDGKFRLYIPGVGTPCSDIGEDNYAAFGPSMGRGGDRRMNYALLSVLNYVHRAISNDRRRYAPETILALCRNGKRGYSHRTNTYYPLKGGVQDVQALSAVGMRTEGGLLSDGNGARPHAEAFYQREVQALADKIARVTKPKLVNIALDVFGFSRGATQAQWLIPYLAWRYQVRDVYASRLSWVARAQQTFPNDVQDLAGANQTLLADIAALEGLTDEEIQRYQDAARFNPSLYSGLAVGKAMRRATLASEAQDVLTHIKAHPVLGTSENPEHLTPQAYLFANYMHDSYAGFRPFDQPQAWAGCIDPVPSSWETQGYLRYRRVYQGTGKPVTYAPPTEQQRQEAAQREQEAQLRSMQNSVDMRKLFNGHW